MRFDSRRALRWWTKTGGERKLSIDLYEPSYRLPLCASVARPRQGLAITVVVTLALGIGANAAIISVVRGVLLRPLVNRDQDSLIYLQQSAPGIGVENAKFSIPELRDLQARVKTLTANC